MDYILELRQLVGPRPLILTGATVLVLNNDNQVLMMRRTDNDCWGVPGGAMELGETFEETARRETREEIGVELGSLELFGLQSGLDGHYIYANGDEIYGACAIYLAREIRGGIILNTDEHSAYRYFDLDHLPEKISPPMKPIMQELVKRYRKS